MRRVWVWAVSCVLILNVGCNPKDVDDAKKKVDSAVNSAQEAIEAITDFKLGDVDLKEKFQGISVALQQEVLNVIDAESAKESLPKFEELLGQLKQLKEMFAKLPANVRAALGKFIGTETVTLDGIFEVCEENYGDGVKPVLNNVFQSIIKELQGFK